MRVTNNMNAYNSLTSVQSGMNTFYKINQQLNSGYQISNSYEGANTYIDSARLEYEIQTLEQVEKAASMASEMMKNTDSALEQMVSLISQFQVKVTQAVNATQSQTSREAIAKELTRIKEEIVNLANTSVNGQYLFSGSLTNTKPFDIYGNYFGNQEDLNIVTGDRTTNSYNIPGYDLFFKPDNDFYKQITTNVSFTDNRYNLVDNPDKTRYLTASDSFKNLVGLNYFEDNAWLDPKKHFEDEPLDLPPTVLYVQGKRPDGTSFKSSVLVEPDDTLQSMFDKIGAVYGNTSTNKVVDISINESGQIQIKDLKQGNNSLDFHAVAFTPQFESEEQYHDVLESLENQGNTLEDLTNAIMQEALNASGGDITNLNPPVTVGIDGVNYEFGLSSTEFISGNMTDTDGNQINGADYDNVFFERDGNKVYGNVSQIIQASGEYASESTKLSEVSGTSLENTVLNLTVNSKGGNTYEVSVDLGNSTVSYTNAAGQVVSFPIMQTDPLTGNSGIVTPSNEISYKQLNDIIGLFASDQVPTTSINAVNNQINAADYQTYQTALQDSKSTVEVNLDYKGRITVTDRLSTGTNIGVAIHDSNSTQFAQPPFSTTANVTEGASLSFNANNALIIDEPHVDFIKDLDNMIEAVSKGYIRADANSEDPRNTGMQGALARLDHLGEHLRKQRTIIGADAAAVEKTADRATMLKLNVKEIRSGVIDIDLAAVLTNMMQTQINYQAALKATSTMSQLSLLNYM
ncbi:flagellar hook-associated protein [Campylobacter avium LMG 24591]|uniref:Flagellin n=1 Tax=Campylobacter avium LMG 24591 TaxID=522484 RepID=A0A222MX56_9BACT|nr:flagellar hook-associated protein FlgL [Campylobacter avium]ASQ30401.1 flagellar hook-associated protein [Campylobacter avium LMG 24591]OYD79499.1 flagellar hook-associated protein [Campylobacter avium]